MRIFANLFLILFACDGILSLLTAAISLIAPLPPTGLQDILSEIVILLSIAMYICLGIDSRLPKRVFLPLVLFVLWCPLSIWIFPGLAGFRIYPFLMAVIQVVFCMLPLYHFGKERRSILVPRETFGGTFFSAKNTAIFAGVNLLLSPLFLAIFGLYVANETLAGYTAGFMRVAPDGLHMSERVFQRGNKTVRLAAMIHIGDREYYDAMAKSIAGRGIVLAEGVSDRRQLLAHKLDYRKVAGVLGLSSQDKMMFKGRMIDEKQLDQPSVEPADDEGKMADILLADVDMSSFHPETIHFLDQFGTHMQKNKSAVTGMMVFNSWAQKNMTEELQTTIMNDILYARNKELLRNLHKALKRYDTIVVPWGALHMPELEEKLIEEGFELTQEKERMSINWWNLFRIL